MTSATACSPQGRGIIGFFRSLFDFTDFTGTGWVGHDPAMPKGGYNDAIFR